MANPRTVFVASAIIGLVIVIAIAPLLFSKRWLGLDNTGGAVMGKYGSLTECQRDVEKTGGWCGKDCVQHGTIFADCNPLIEIHKHK